MAIVFLIWASLLTQTSFADIQIQKQTEAFGSSLGFEFNSTANTAQDGLLMSLLGLILGQQKSLINFNVQPTTDLLEGESSIYVGSIQVIATPFTWNNGSLQSSIEIPPVDVRIPVVALPVGPIVVKVDAGFAVDASLTASLTPTISIPVQFSTVKADVTPNAQALAFVEGYAQFIALRGGVGGEVTVIDANADVSAQLNLGATPPSYSISGFLDFLKGSIYAFADYFQVFGWRWVRFWNPTLYQWNGTCLDLTHNSQAAGSCAAN